jgi:hypothetical protein
MLIKEDVVQTAAEPDFITHSHARKLVGGSFLNSLRNASSWLSSKITPVKEWLKAHVDHPIANTAVRTAEALGYGVTGAGSHGKLHNRLY